jgi:hypothetical protein
MPGAQSREAWEFALAGNFLRAINSDGLVKSPKMVFFKKSGINDFK